MLRLNRGGGSSDQFSSGVCCRVFEIRHCLTSLCEYENVNSMYMSNDNEWEKNLLPEGTVLRIIGFIWTLFYNQLGLEDKLNKIVINK